MLDVGLLAHRDDVREGPVAQEAGHGGLREDEQLAGVGQFGQGLGAQPGDAEPGRLVDGGVTVTDGAPLSAEDHEVAVAEPAQQGGDVGAVRPGEPGPVVGVDLVGQPRHRGGQGC